MNYQNLSTALFVVVLSAFAFLGCDGSHPSSPLSDKNVSKLSEQLKSLVDRPEQTLEEYKKLRQLEYKVLNLSENESPQTLEEQLQQLGKDRWDCTAHERLAEGNKPKMFLICKRSTETPLRYLPRGLLN